MRSVDVAAELGVSKASVSIAMRHLEEAGYISMDGRRTIRLTEKGRRIAETVYERHLLFSDLFTSLGVNRETAPVSYTHLLFFADRKTGEPVLRRRH